MLFSFLLCVHQDQPYLDQAVKSMVAQDYAEDYEIIIVANNCSDVLYEKLKGYLVISNKIRLYRTTIGQLAFNLNYGIDKSCADYVVRMDADDVSFPNRLTNTKTALNYHKKPDLLGALAQKINESDAVIGTLGKPLTCSQVRRALYYKNPIIHPGAAIKRSSILKAKGYLGGIHCEDRDLWLRMDRLGMRILVEDFVAIKYRISSHQVSGSRIAYADNAGLLLREGLYRTNFLYMAGAFYSCFKFVIFSIFRKMK